MLSFVAEIVFFLDVPNLWEWYFSCTDLERLSLFSEGLLIEVPLYIQIDMWLLIIYQSVPHPPSSVTVTWLLLSTTVSPSADFVMEFLTAQAFNRQMKLEISVVSQSSSLQ